MVLQERDLARRLDGTSPIRLFVVDGHHIVREGLIGLVDLEPDMEVVGEAASAEEALISTRIYEADLVITAMRLPGINGAELCRELAENRISARVVILSGYADREAIRFALHAGVSAYVLKETDGRQLLRTIRAVARGEHPLNGNGNGGRVIGINARTRDPKNQPLPPSLQRVLRLLCEGKSYKVISEATGLSLNTVKKYLGRLYKTLGVRGRAEAVVEAIHRGLV